jgi:membrane-bound serine protease (ClpP class)
MRKVFHVLQLLAFILFTYGLIIKASSSHAIGEVTSSNRPVVLLTIDGTINPASDDYLKTSIKSASEKNAQLIILRLNTPGGLLPSMQSMVESLLESPIPVVVYVSPSGAGAISAGVFITLAGHFAVMSPGTTIGAAHPVTGGGEDITGDMRTKIENASASLIRAISEQRGKNIEWAEKAVRESVSITDREALEINVIDFIAGDLNKLLIELEGKTSNVKGNPVTLTNLQNAPQETIEMSFKQKVVNILSDPNIAILLGLAAILGIGIELYNPGAMLPGIVGVICLVLSLTAAQVLPINYGGLALLILGFIFFIIELFLPAFGMWGIAGIICLVIGSIYLIDTDLVWSVGGFAVDKVFIGGIAGIVGGVLLLVVYLVLKSSTSPVTTGKEGLVQKTGSVRKEFSPDPNGKYAVGMIMVMGEIWKARTDIKHLDNLKTGSQVRVTKIEPGMTLVVEPNEN